MPRFCSKCFKQNSDDAEKCTACGEEFPYETGRRKIQIGRAETEEVRPSSKRVVSPSGSSFGESRVSVAEEMGGRKPIETPGKKEPATVPRETPGKKEPATVPRETPGKKEPATVPRETPGKKEPATVPRETPGKKEPATVPRETPGKKEPATVPRETPGKKEPATVPRETPGTPGVQKPLLSKSSPGEVLNGRYQILQVLKSSGMGGIFKARDLQTGQTVIVKKMLVFYMNTEDVEYGENKFREGLKPLMDLKHPGLPSITDIFISQDSYTGKTAYYMVTDFIEGKDLGTIMRERNGKPLSVSKSLKYFIKTLQILKYLHGQSPSVIYRDLKPSNIIVKEDGEIFLVDFGFAMFYLPEQTGKLIGTPAYSSPEQYQGICDVRSDIYSLGVVMHYLLTGQDPQDDSRTPFTFAPLRDINSEVPWYLHKIIKSMLDLEMNNRPPSAEHILDMLNKREKGVLGVLDSASSSSEKISTLPDREKLLDRQRRDPPSPEKVSLASYDLPTPPPEEESTPAPAKVEKTVKTEKKKGNGISLWTLITLILLLAMISGVGYIAYQKINVDKPDKEGMTSLHRACLRGKQGEIDYLLLLGANVNAKNKDGDTPLHLAIRGEHEDIIHLLIVKKAEVDGVNGKGETPLHTAVLKGNKHIVKILTDNKADINAKTNTGKTPLFIAVESGNTQVTDFLIEQKADVNIKDDLGISPLHIAAEKGDKNLSEKLLLKNADCNAENHQGKTPLMLAQEKDNKDLMTLLENYGAVDLNAKGEHGRTVLHTASISGNRKKVEFCLQKGADVNAPDDEGKTPLHHACKSGLREIAEILIDKGADVNAKTKNKTTPLHYSAMGGFEELTELLIMKGAKINSQNDKGQTPLHLTCQAGKKEVAEVLLSNGADPNIRDLKGDTPLSLSVDTGNKQIFELLLSNHGDINIKDKDGLSLLHKAVLKNNQTVTELLLSRGLDVNQKDPQGKTPVDLAKSKNFKEMEAFLRQKGGKESIVPPPQLPRLY